MTERASASFLHPLCFAWLLATLRSLMQGQLLLPKGPVPWPPTLVDQAPPWGYA
jgi:hypothetical protein